MKTIEEKAREYTDSTDTRVFGCEETLDATELIQKGYIAGAKDALRSQWRSVDDEMPDEGDYSYLVAQDVDGYGTLIVSEMYCIDGLWYRMSLNDETAIPENASNGVVAWMYLPEPPKIK